MGTPLAPFRTALASQVASSQGLSGDRVATLEASIRTPAPERGDLALPVFTWAKEAGQRPDVLARQVAEALAAAGDPNWSRVHAEGAYVNVTVSAAALARAVVPAARSADYLRDDQGRGRTVVIDYSSPNIAKPLGFHHVRTTVIGAAIARLHAACGWNVVGINYLGDWGRQFGLLATGFARHGDPNRIDDAKHLVEVYIRANQEADVARVQERIDRPAAARKLVKELEELRAQPTPAGGKEAKKHAKKLKGLERRLDALGGPDPTEGPELEAWFASLERDAEAAREELPGVEARAREARQYLRRMEEGDEAALAEWRRFREASIREFQRVYDRLGIEFSSIEGESLYQNVLESTVERVRAMPGTRESDGAEVVDLDYGPEEPPVILKTRDGTTLYLTRDIAAAIDRYERFEFDRSLYVVGADQALHFAQLFRTLEAMGHTWADRCHHVPFGRLRGMSTRRGTVVFLDEVLDEAEAKAREICEASEKIDPAHLDEAVTAIGIGAVVFQDLKNLRTNDYTFDWNDVLNFNGHTGPYVQFAHARACSILRKGGGVPSRADLSRLETPEERAVMKALARLPEVLVQACEAFEPSMLTRAVLELAQTAASYFTAGNRDRAARVLVEDDPELRAARLHLTDAIRASLAAGLETLGLRAPEAM
ncbi:MAG TPA: arginine--tRNA ligase [Myxococcales bacterium LLY-WYZ-16_1]|nr:arginine--tRNA ligase [Myxococcales bacterium LLY-WYZ-16_1]